MTKFLAFELGIWLEIRAIRIIRNFQDMISIEQTKHIAGLSRIGATEKDIDKFSHDLSVILDWMKQLEEVNLKGVEPTAHISGVKNVLREDKVKEL